MQEKTVDELIADVEHAVQELFLAIPRAVGGVPDQYQKRCKDALDALAKLREKHQGRKDGTKGVFEGK